MRPRVAVRALLLAVTGAWVPVSAAAQGSLSLDMATTVAFPTPAVADYDAGWVEPDVFTVRIQSRPQGRSWELRLRAADALLGPGKPVSDLLWREASSGVWRPLSTSDAVVLQGAGDRDVVLHFRMRLDWSTDAPGTYATDLDFTVLRI